MGSPSEYACFQCPRALVRDVFQAFGPDRILWGGLGKTIADFNLQNDLLTETFAFTTAADIEKIRGGNAMRLWWEEG